MKRFFIVLCVVAVTLSLGCFAQGAVVVVSPGNMNGWAFYQNDADGNVVVGTGIAQMVTGPATPPLGTGSAQLATGPGAGDGASQISTAAYSGVSLASLTALSYSTYDVTNNGQQFPYLKLNISTQGDANIDDALFFEPPYQTPSAGNPSLPDQGATVLATWQSWNALTGGWWDNNGVFNPGVSESGSPGVNSLSAFLALYPDATIVDSGGSSGAISLRVGYASASDNFNGYVDNFTIGVNGANTTYDFDPAAPVPEPSTIIVWSLLGGIAITVGRWRWRKAA